MDAFLSDIYVDVFRKWIVGQLQGREFEETEDAIRIPMEYCIGEITFNVFNIIELRVESKVKDDIIYYLHFQMQNLAHATGLFREMMDALDAVTLEPQIKALFCCSGGLTTGFFAQKINETMEILGESIEVTAVGYGILYQVASDYDLIYLAPQISYEEGKVQQYLPDKVVGTIPAQVFAKYDVKSMVQLITGDVKKVGRTKGESYDINVKNTLTHPVLCISVYQNNGRNHIDYRIYNPDLSVVDEDTIIKNTISVRDIEVLIKTEKFMHEDIAKIAVSLPGIVDDGSLYSSFVEGACERLDDKLAKISGCDVILLNDVNSATLGYMAMDDRYTDFAFLFQPVNLDAGLGTVANGRLVTGKYHMAGEVKFLPLSYSAPKLELSGTPEGAHELVYKMMMTIVAINSPQAIVLCGDLVGDTDDYRRELREALTGHIDYDINILKVRNFEECVLLGLMNACLDREDK